MKQVFVGQRIRQLVEEQHWNISDFAKAINCSRSSLYSIFNSKDISLLKLYQISAVLKYDLVGEIVKELCSLHDDILQGPNSPYITIPFVDSELDLSGLPPCIIDMLKNKLNE